MTDGYEPGSTLKAVLLASAVSHGWKLSDQLWGEKGTFYVQGKKISEAEAKEKFEWVNLRKMIQVSSNIVAAKLALKVGADNYYSTLKTFGFGSKTGSGFPGEISGRLMGRNEWTPLSLANFGFGQGVLVTPIQMLRAYATFANGGFLVQPTFLKSPLEGAKHEAPKRIISQKVADTVTEALKSPLEEGGTGVKAKVDGYLVAGKTGTAQTVDPETGHYSRSRYISSFIGYPVGVDPKLVIFTSIDEPRGVYYASETAAPLFRAVLQAAVTRLSMPNVLARTPATLTPKEKAPLKDRLQWSLAKVIDPLEVGGTASDGTLLWKMPNLLGLTPREALRVLQGRHFQLEVHGAGMIQTQVPEAGKSIADGSKIRLNLIEP